MKITDIFTELLYDKSRLIITFEKGQNQAVARLKTEIGTIDPNKDYEVAIKPKKKSRSQDANKLMWACIGDIAHKLVNDKWNVYLEMLKRYGKFTYIVVRENAVDEVKKQWRESEVVGEVTVNGQKAVQMLCYYGSSTYSTKEFSVLLDGIISEMKEMGLTPPTSEDMKAALERWDKQCGKS